MDNGGRMTIEELHKKLSEIITTNSDCKKLPIRILRDIICVNCEDHNSWLDSIEIQETDNSGYEESGELLLIGRE